MRQVFLDIQYKKTCASLQNFFLFFWNSFWLSNNLLYDCLFLCVKDFAPMNNSLFVKAQSRILMFLFLFLLWIPATPSAISVKNDVRPSSVEMVVGNILIWGYASGVLRRAVSVPPPSWDIYGGGGVMFPLNRSLHPVLQTVTQKTLCMCEGKKAFKKEQICDCCQMAWINHITDLTSFARIYF